MRCTHSVGAPPASVCKEDATWQDRCPAHGGTHPSTTELMTLLSKLTGWSDQSLSVAVGYKRARVWNAQDDSHLDNDTWGFTAGTRVLGQDHDLNAQGRTLEEALWALCIEIGARVSSAQERAADRAVTVDKAMGDFVRSRRVP